MAPSPPALAYPVEALGSPLAPFVEATVEATRCAEATAAHSALAAATIAAQAHVDVRTPAGVTRPCSLFLFTVASSGERKSAADRIALLPIRNTEADAKGLYDFAWRGWRNSHDAWEAERAKIKRDNKLTRDRRRDALDELGPEPLEPIRPDRAADDLTIEGLVKLWPVLPGSFGLFADEAAKVIGGHAMTDEARLRTAATLANLWDAGRASRLRAGDGFLSLRGRRLAVHLMAQPGVAASFLTAADLNDQGLIGRFLVAEAPEKAGDRLFRDPPPPTDLRFTGFNHAIGRLLAMAPPTVDGRNELEPRFIDFAPEARRAWIELHDEIEAKLGPGGELACVKPFGSKLPEHAARLAAILQVIANSAAGEITVDTMNRAAILARFYAAEAARLATRARVDVRLAEAERLRTWLVEDWADPLVSIRAIMRFGPNVLRPKATAERCVDILADHGWLLPAGDGEVKGERARETWRIACGGSREKGSTPATVATLATKPPPNPETVATVATVARGEAENTPDRGGPHADALLELADCPPPNSDPIAWRDACEGAAMFEGIHGLAARSKGWTVSTLYGAAPVNPLGQPDRLGAALRIGREGVRDVTPDCIVTLTGCRIAPPSQPASPIKEWLHG